MRWAWQGPGLLLHDRDQAQDRRLIYLHGAPIVHAISVLGEKESVTGSVLDAGM